MEEVRCGEGVMRSGEEESSVCKELKGGVTRRVGWKEGVWVRCKNLVGVKITWGR
jgi:hypothetical protein